MFFMHSFAAHIFNDGTSAEPLEVSAEALEDALVRSSGDGGVLQSIHVALLSGVMWKR